MKKSFVFGLITAVLAVGLCSCGRGCKTRGWQGGNEIPPEGGTVVWRPANDVNEQVIPNIIDVHSGFYDSNYNWVGSTQLDVESLKIKGDGFEKITGEWYEVLSSTNVVIVTFSSNDTTSKRELVAFIQDGSYELGPDVRVSQSPKSRSQE